MLGASNLAIGLPLIFRQLFAGLPRPLEIFTAWDTAARSVPGAASCFAPCRESIAAACGPTSTRRPKRESRTLAIVTDVGNDLIYGSSPQVIARRVESCLEALARRRAELVVTRLPLASVEWLSALRYRATKAVFFPRSGGVGRRCGRKRELDESLGQIATRFSARLVEQPLDWYGFDPLHIRRSRRAGAWQTFSRAGRRSRPRTRDGPLSLADVVRLRLAAPAERRLLVRPANAPATGPRTGRCPDPPY